MSTTTAHSTDPIDALEPFRRELTAYCYRMLGSASEAEDAVQETLLRAWRGFDGFEGRASLRTWLYRIATNACLDMAGAVQRRARPMDLGPSTRSPDHPGPVRDEATWLGPVPDARVLDPDADPADVAVTRDSVRLAFVAALQHLPARQRAVLILRDVLRWRAAEVAALLETTTASVNSALQRARDTMQRRDPAATDPWDPTDRGQQDFLARYVDAFERYDVDELVALLHEDAVMSMPPFALWLQGSWQIGRWFAGPGAGCEGSRLLPTVANGAPAFAQYRRSSSGDGHVPWALQVLELSGGRIAGFTAFLDTDRLFPVFDLPPAL